MALQKSIELNNSGIFATYWKIINITYNYFGSINIIMAGYSSEDTRQNNKNSLTVKSFDIIGDDFNNFVNQTGDVRATAYTYIKSIPNGEFADAVDV